MTDEDILDKLLSGGADLESSWETFLRRHSNLILKIVWQFEKDYDQAMEKYLYVCKKLAAGNFTTLRRFQHQFGEKSPKFTTWLAAVVRNLCIDEHRMLHGRRQLPRAVMRLPEFDREVFRLYYWKGYSEEEIEHQLSETSGSNAVAEALVRLQEILAGQSTRVHQERTIVPYQEGDEYDDYPDRAADFTEMLGWLEQWLDKLADEEKMILRLRFWEGMTGREIADAMKISPEQRVYPLLNKALTNVRKHAMETYAIRKSGNISV